MSANAVSLPKSSCSRPTPRERRTRMVPPEYSMPISRAVTTISKAPPKTLSTTMSDAEDGVERTRWVGVQPRS